MKRQDIKKALTEVLPLVMELSLNSLTKLTFRELDVVLGAAVVIHQREEIVVGDVELNDSSVRF